MKCPGRECRETMTVCPDGAFLCPACGITIRLTEFTGGTGRTTASKGKRRARYERVRKPKAPRTDHARNARIVCMHALGHSTRDIAIAHGLTRERVQQIVRRSAGTIVPTDVELEARAS